LWKLLKLAIAFVKLDSITFDKFSNHFDEELPKEML